MTDLHRTVGIIELVSVAALAVVVTVVTSVQRHRGGMPLYADQLRATDRATRAEVWQALRAGHSADPEVDVLATRVAERTIRVRFAYRVMAVIIVLNAIPPVLDLFQRHPPWLTVSARAAGAIVLAAVLIPGYVGLRRCQRYLRHRPS